LYQTENGFYLIFRIFSILSIVIACLGLFALAAYTVETRTKEIGVRKVLGASLHHILAILSLDFIRSVLIAGILALPIAYYAMNKWLENFAYQIEMQWWYFILPSAVVLGVALITISFQTIKAALSNPVESLKYE
jgi:putative ABC transport system permease protein